MRKLTGLTAGKSEDELITGAALLPVLGKRYRRVQVASEIKRSIVSSPFASSASRLFPAACLTRPADVHASLLKAKSPQSHSASPAHFDVTRSKSSESHEP